MRSAWLRETAVAEAAGGAGWLSVYTRRQLSFYPALSLALLSTSLLML